MFTIEIKVNGALIGHIYGRNTGEYEDGKTKYAYEYYEPEEPRIRKGHVLHQRDHGIRPLITAILKDLE